MVSHTSTGEWQSFEVRMRRRRAERLLVRAEAAVEADSLDDARTCLAEARALAPDLPALDALERRLSPPPALDEPVRTQSRTATAAAAVLALVSVAVLVLVAWPIARTPDVQPVPVTVSAPATVPATAEQPRDPAPQPPLAAAATPDVTPAPVAAETPETKSPAREPAPQDVPASLPDSEEARPRAPLVDPLPSAESTPGRVTVPSPPALVATLPASAGVPALPSASIPPPAAPPAPEPSQEPAVRSVLERYASAYSALDVEATQRVWPGVNRGALSRAFDSLESQDVSLGDCRIDVTGTSATARCAGTASWTPRIGDGGRRSEAREWTFELARRAAGWEIVNARVQNR
jgi:hypothetical protein